MDNFNFEDLQPFLFVAIGLAAIYYSLFKKSTNQALKANGEKAEGIIFKLYNSPGSSLHMDTNIKNKVTVRFVTKDKTWITEPIKQDFAMFYSYQYKEGQTVNVYYDPKDPLKFYVDSKQSELIARLAFGFFGLIFCAIGIYQIFLK